MDLSIITVTWNSKDRIGEQIRSVVRGCVDISFEEIVVDNGSTDGTADCIRNEFSNILVIANENNVGFGAANNQAVAMAKGDFLLFLNPDMRVESGSLDSILRWMRGHPEVGIASPKLLDDTGRLNWEATPRRFPRLWEQVALVLKITHLFPRILDAYLMKNFDPEKKQAVDTVRGSFMIMRRELIETLGWAFDPRYFIWYEDVDLCREARRLGYKVFYTPVITCVDYVGQSFKKRTNLWKQRHFTRSMLIYFQKWEPWWMWIWIWLTRPFGIGIVWVSEKFHTDN